MAHDEKTAARVRRSLSKHGAVVEKPMMGGLAFMVDGAMCCSVGKDSLLVRVGTEGREAALALPHVKPMKLGARVMKGFVRVAPEGFATAPALKRWLAVGIAAGRSR
jgi:TfoX/Sxy family transcriptional regulator of competence genes